MCGRLRPPDGLLALARSQGFTLIELLVTMSVSAVVVGFMALFITAPVSTYLAQSRRTELNKSQESAWSSVAGDVRVALPNSVRIMRNGTVVALEMLATLDWARYRDGTVMTSPATQLDLTAPDGSFATTSKFLTITRPWVSNAYFLAINNRGVPGADAYQLANVITPPGTVITISNSATAGEDQVTLAPPFRFMSASPTHRVFLVSGPVNYLCDESGGTLRRYIGYGIAGSLAARDSAAQLNAAGASSALIATNVAACNFAVSAGTAQHGQIVTLQITFTQAGESIHLMQQAHVENLP
jgi:MSHA biogenesis protein MshO